MVLALLPAEALAEETHQPETNMVQTELQAVDVDIVEDDPQQDESTGANVEISPVDTKNALNQTNAEPDDTTMLGSGFCGGEGNGENLQWTLDQEGTLRIWGNGAMGRCVTIGDSGRPPAAPWYNLRVSIKKVVIEDGVTAIGESAFCDCTNLVSVTMPDTVVEIMDAVPMPSGSIGSGGTSYKEYDGAFFGCLNLETIYLSKNLKTLGAQAFRNCISLQSITIPHGVTALSDAVFQGCTSLQKVNIEPDSEITLIGFRAFQGCSMLQDIQIPSKVTRIDAYAFQSCQTLEAIDIPDGVKTLGIGRWWSAGEISGSYDGYVFSGCTNLKTLQIPESVTDIRTINIYTSDAQLCPKETLLLVAPDSVAEKYAKDNNLQYTYILQGRMLSVQVQDENGSELSEGFTVTWYDEDGNPLGTNPTLSGAARDKSYMFDIQLGEELASRYEQPQRQTIAPEDDAARVVQLVPKVTVPTLTLTGRVLDKSGTPVAGAAVSVLWPEGEPVETSTAADGSFSATVQYAALQVTIQKDGYYTKRQFLDLTGETGPDYQMENCILTEAVTVSDRLTLDITRRMASKDQEEALETPVTSVKTLQFTLTGSDGRNITDFEVQGNSLLFQSGAVSANEIIVVAVEDPSGNYTGASVSVTLDANRLGSAELAMTEKGSFRLGSLSGPEATLLVFDSGGKCVQTSTAQGGMSSGNLNAGTYSIILLQKSDLLRGVPSLGYLTTLGLAAGQDYLLRSVTITDGQITSIGDCTVPALDERAFSYTVTENTSVTTNKPSGAAVGELILLRASYQLDPTKGVSANALSISLSDGIEPMTNVNISLDGVATPYVYDSANREAKVSVAGKSKGTVYMYCTATAAGSQSVSAYLTMNGGAVQAIGSAVVQVENARIDVPERVGRAEGLIASGKTLPKSKVTLYDNDTVVGTTTSNAVGSWSMEFDLAQPVYTYSYHFVYAVTESTELPQPLTTEESMITYNTQTAGQVTRITMYNTAHTANNLDPWEQKTVFDFTKESTEKPYYRIWPWKYPTFTFKSEFEPKDIVSRQELL